MHRISEKGNRIHILSDEELNMLYKENQEDINWNTAYTDRMIQGEIMPLNLHDTMVSIINDIYVEGTVMRYPHGTVIRQGERRNYYRGECEDYPSSKSTFFRRLDMCSSMEEKEIVTVVEKMRYLLFQHFLESL